MIIIIIMLWYYKLIKVKKQLILQRFYALSAAAGRKNAAQSRKRLKKRRLLRWSGHNFLCFLPEAKFSAAGAFFLNAKAKARRKRRAFKIIHQTDLRVLRKSPKKNFPAGFQRRFIYQYEERYSSISHLCTCVIYENHSSLLASR